MRLVQETTARVATDRPRAIAARPPPLADSSFVSGVCAASGGRDDSGASLTEPSYRTWPVWQAQPSRNDQERTDWRLPPPNFSLWRVFHAPSSLGTGRGGGGVPCPKP